MLVELSAKETIDEEVLNDDETKREDLLVQGELEGDLELDIESCSLRRGAADVRFVFRIFPQSVVFLEVVEGHDAMSGACVDFKRCKRGCEVWVVYWECDFERFF